LRPERDLARAADATESPDEPDARYRSRYAVEWTGYLAHLTETCEEDAPHLITHVDTTPATVHEVRRVEAIHQALAAKDLLPGEHLADAAYIDAKLLVKVRNEHGVQLIGPPRKDASWQARTEGAFTNEDFAIDWDRERVCCPQGHESNSWRTYEDEARGQYILVRFQDATCRACPAREHCTRSPRQGRSLHLHPREAHDAITSMRDYLAGDAGHKVYGLRAGVEGTISQGVRAFGLRHARYRGLAKVHLQHVATAAAMNIDRVTAFLEGRPLESTRTSRFAALRA
jgi:IS5 family transposase